MSIEPEIQALLKALRARLEALAGIRVDKKNGTEVFLRGDHAFLQIEVRRDHLSLDIWLPEKELDEARASGTARAHPFLGDNALKLRFERAADLAKMARWIETSYGFALVRTKVTKPKVDVIVSQVSVPSPESPSGTTTPSKRDDSVGKRKTAHGSRVKTTSKTARPPRSAATTRRVVPKAKRKPTTKKPARRRPAR